MLDTESKNSLILRGFPTWRLFGTKGCDNYNMNGRYRFTISMKKLSRLFLQNSHKRLWTGQIVKKLVCVFHLYVYILLCLLDIVLFKLANKYCLHF